MRLALLGADAEAIDFIEDALFGSLHELTAAFDVGNFRPTLRNLAPRVRLDEDWETLLLGSAADLVIVARGQGDLAPVTGIPDDERRADQLRKLAQAAVPMLVFCPACEAIIGFEIEMIRRDSGGVIIPYVPQAANPGLLRMEDCISWQAGSPIGKTEQVVLERQQQDRSRSAVLTQLARDVALVRRLIGMVQSVTATGPPPVPGRDPLGPKPKELPSLANLSVHLTGDEGLSARWSLSSGRPESARLTALGDRGQATLEMPAQGNWLWEIAAGERVLESLPVSDLADQVLDDADHAISIPEERYDERAWLNACRDQEVAEAIDRSLLKGRTIELFNEEHTEEQSFKGVMAMGGCLILMLALGVLGFVVLVEGLQLPIRRLPMWRFWPGFLLAPIAIFLLMQLLGLAVPKQSAAAAAAKPAAPGK